MDFRLVPSLLFTPANKPERFAKAKSMGGGGVIIDLENSVRMEEKDQARDIAFDYLKKKSDGKFIQILRINNIETQAGLADLLALSKINLAGCDAILHPKTENPQAINLIHTILATYQVSKPLIALIETARGMAQVEKIAMRAKHLVGLMFGAADYALAVGCSLKKEGLLYARSKLANAAGLKQLACYDSPYFDFHDQIGLTEESSFVRTLGFTGKCAIHPDQIITINQTFKPTEAQYEDAKQIIALYEAAHGNACQYKGNMIDVPLYELAKRTVKLYEEMP